MSKDRLVGKERLLNGQRLTSLNGRYQLAVQNDGNVVIYDTQPKTVAIWSTRTGKKDGTNNNYLLCMQSNQNLVLYKDSPTAANVLWQSKTQRKNIKNIVLSLQNDGNLVGFGDGVQFWSSHSSENQRIEKQLKEQLKEQKQTMDRIAQQQANQLRTMQKQLQVQRALASCEAARLGHQNMMNRKY